jgi:NADPH-dependent 2,4-dienoyl-CoA reductase/sulfur reductase-like enzyme
LPLYPRSYYADLDIELVTGRAARAIDPRMRRVFLDDGVALKFDQLLMATGAAPVGLDIPMEHGQAIHYLRTLADSRRIIRAAEGSRRAVVLGTSFIGLEVAAALRTRGLEVHAVGPDALPLGRVLGPELGAFIQRLHEEHGVVFHLGSTPRRWGSQGLILDDGTCLAADLVVAGIGVLPNVDLAAQAGLATDRGILVDEYLETSASGVFAAGDVARWIEPRTGDAVRIEHWVVAQRMGQTAARNMLGQQEAFDAVPFFWSQHYDVPIAYVGYVDKWDRAIVEGDLASRDGAVTYYRNGQARAQATINRDRQSLTTELAMEPALVPANQEG